MMFAEPPRPSGEEALLGGKVRKDALLGPVFDARIADWEPHLQRRCTFWSSVALMSGVYHGRPMEKHLPLPVDARHFDRSVRRPPPSTSLSAPIATATAWNSASPDNIAYYC